MLVTLQNVYKSTLSYIDDVAAEEQKLQPWNVNVTRHWLQEGELQIVYAARVGLFF